MVGVEELALLHYGSAAGGGWRGLHSEGGVWATLWALLLWDVTFMHVPEVFRWGRGARGQESYKL